MDPETVNCPLNVAATDDSEFTYGEAIRKAVALINCGNGVDIDDIAEFIKERYEVPVDFRKKLRGKLKKLLADKTLYKVDKRYRFFEGNICREATDPTKILNREDRIEELIYELYKLDCEIKQDKIDVYFKISDGAVTREDTNPTQILTPQDSTKSHNLSTSTLVQIVNTKNSTEPQDLPTSSLELLDGAATTTEATNPEDSTKKQDRIKKDVDYAVRTVSTMKQEHIDYAVETIVWAECHELEGREISELANKMDQLCEDSHMNLLLAREYFNQCKIGIEIPLASFTEDIFEDWLVDISAYLQLQQRMLPTT